MRDEPLFQDEQLFDLVREKDPEELTFEEIQALRARLPELPELQHMLASRVELDRYLSASLGRVDVSVDAIVRRAGRPSLVRVRSFAPLGLAPCLMLGLFLTAVICRAWYTPSEPVRVALNSMQPTGDGADGAVSAPPTTTQSASDQHVARAPSVADAGRTASSDGGQQPAVPAGTALPDVSTPSHKPTAGVKPLSDGVAGAGPKGSPGGQKAASSQTPQPRTPDEQSPAADAKAPPARELEPWEAENQLGGPVVNWEDLAFRDFTSEDGSTTLASLQRWVQGAAGNRFQTRDDRQGPFLEGLARLRAPWSDNAVLRLSLRLHHAFQIHAWRGEEGVMLRFYDNLRPWVAWAGYRTSRRGAAPLPESFAMTSSDQGLHWRLPTPNNSPFVTLDVRYEDGALLLCRGDVRLLAVPLSGPPEEIYLDGTVQVHDIRMLRCTPLPDREPSRPLALDLQQLGDRRWRKTLSAGSDFSLLPDGRVRLVAEEKSQPARAATSFSAPGLHEIVLEVEDATPGTGIYLGDDEGNPLYTARVLRGTTTGRLLLRLLPAGEQRSGSDEDFVREALAYVPHHFWVKLLYVGGYLRCWVSVDGKHWGRSGQGWDTFAGSRIGSIGLLSASGAEPRRITLCRVQARAFPAFNALADAELLKQAPAIALPNVRRWLMEVGQARPADAANDAWFTAAAAASLGAGAPRETGALLMRQLLATGLNESRPAEDRLALLEEAIELCDLRVDERSRAYWSTLAEPLDRVGLELLRQGELRPFTRAGKCALAVATEINTRGPCISERLARTELVALVAAGHWQEVSRLAEELATYNSTALTPLVNWALALADRQLPREVGSSRVAIDHRWRHPLSVELSKEGFNVLAELDAALGNEAWNDACQIISSARWSGGFGLLPDPADGDLWVSFPLAVANAIEQHPPLLATMQEQFGPLADLRVRQAIDEGDAPTLEAATVQFHGTLAAGRAHLWLGDRAVSIGDFARALRHYRLAETPASMPLRLQITAHRRLAAALLGRDEGSAATVPVQLGGQQLSPTQFEALVAKVRQHSTATAGLPDAAAGGSSIRLPAPIAVGLVPEPGVRIERPRSARVERLRELGARSGIDAIGRLAAFATEGERVYYGDGGAVACYDLAAGQLRWQKPLADSAEKRGAALMAVQPVVYGDRVYVRSSTRTGANLLALDKEKGDIAWQASLADDEDVVSDPLAVGGEVLVLVVQKAGRELPLSLLAFDAANGELRRRARLCLFGQSWSELGTCAVTRSGDLILAVTGGATLCCDVEGTMRWLRRQTWLPPAQMAGWFNQPCEPPLIDGNLVYVTQPGMPTVDCIELASGSRRFSTILPDVHRIVGLADGRLVVEVDDGLLGLDAATGQIVWQRRELMLRCAQLCGGPGGVLIVRWQPTSERGRQAFEVELLWLDPRTGEPTASFRPDVPGDEPVLGPFFKTGNHFWALIGTKPDDPGRSIARLVPKGTASGPPQEPGTTVVWPHIERSQQQRRRP